MDSDEIKNQLQKEYELCASGYNSRDSVVPNEINSMFLFFGILAAFLGFIVTAVWLPRTLADVFIGLIVIAGLFVLAALHLDMTANISCKVALRKRMDKIEDILEAGINPSDKSGLKPADKPIGVWRVIDSRHRLWDERLRAIFSKRQKDPTEEKLRGLLPKKMYDLSSSEDSPYFYWAGRTICAVWGIIGISMFGWNIMRLEPPAIPSVLTVNVVSLADVELTWKDNARNESEYIAERALDSQFTIQLIEFHLASDSTAYVDSTGITQNQYFYRVIAAKGETKSKPSNVAIIRLN